MEGSSEWWPSALAHRRISELVKDQKFGIYRKVMSTEVGKVRIWYFAINADKGIAYGWHQQN
jgi:hypothetical protein